MDNLFPATAAGSELRHIASLSAERWTLLNELQRLRCAAVYLTNTMYCRPCKCNWWDLCK